jgi:hypothetical protein
VRKLLALLSTGPLLAISIVTLSLITAFVAFTSANAAPNSIEIISISETSDSSVEILFNSSIPKKSLSYYVINAAVDPSVGQPKNINKVIKTKATGLITAEIKNLNPKATYNFSISAKTNKGKMISSAPVEYSPLSNLMDAISNLPADWGNPKPIQIPIAAPTTAPVALPAFTLSSSSETRTVNTAATGFTINSTGGAIANFAINATPPGMSFNLSTGALSGTPTSVAGATTYTITATNATGSATQTFALTVTAVVYTVGDRGPGGGIVYYVSDNYFTSTGSACNTTCKYLEAAPSGWNSGADPQKPWATGNSSSGNAILDVDGITNDNSEYNNALGVGLGYANSLAIVTQNGAGTTYAAGAARAYTGGSKTDWYLPTTAELNLLCQLNRGVAIDVATVCTGGNLNSGTYGAGSAGFVADFYWSSSELSATIAWLQNFDVGYQSNGGKNFAFYVRPVRAF